MQEEAETKMNSTERKKDILRDLQDNGSLKVSYLSNKYGVTEETIRRDLSWLEKRGQLLRTHGGAVLYRKDNQELPVTQRELLFLEEKRAIGKYAASLVQEGDVISLDASSSCLHIAKCLPNVAMTVITYSIPIAYELFNKNNIQVFVIGGYLDRHSLANTGAPAEKMVEGYHIDKCFISCHGFDIERGVSEPYEAHAQLKKNIISRSDQLILVADSSKYRKKSLVRLLGFEDLHTFITDQHIDSQFIEQMSLFNTEVIIAK